MSTTKPIELAVRPRGKKIKGLPDQTYARVTDSGKDVYDRIAAKARFDVNRLRITKGSDGTAIPNDARISVESIGLAEQSSIFVKDLGPQIAWRTVFIIEYLGPLLIHPLMYYYRHLLFGNPNGRGPYPEPSLAQTLSMALITLHFVKREFETIFIHRFSNGTMPLFNIFKNSAHYWLLGGVNIALWTYNPWPSCPTARPVDDYILFISIALFVIGEIGNFSAHVTLMNLRPPGTKERRIPSTGVYSFIPVTCPNYFFETIAWAGMWLSNRSLSTGLFVVVAVGQMAIWAQQKEKRYRKEFGTKYTKKRFSMLPGIV